MRRSIGAAVAVLMLIAIVGPGVSLSASAAFHSLRMQAPTNGAASSRGLAIDESFNGQTIHVVKGQVLTVRLKETDPRETWRFADGDRFSVVSDTTLESFPMQHVFRVKVRGPGDLNFAKTYRRSDLVLDQFTVHVVVDEKNAASEPVTTNPLSFVAATVPLSAR